MKLIFTATITTLLAALTCQAAPSFSFRIGYRGSTEYAIAKPDAENANETIAFSSLNTYGLQGLDQWESSNTNQGFMIRNVALRSYISCSGQSATCDLTEDEGTSFQSIQTTNIDGVNYYRLFATTIEDIDGGLTWVLEGGDYLRIGVLDVKNERQEISLQ
ncbi:hypothetical protein CBS63078_2468 [Aspergillus niger]|uniref:Uncharacterized protein n=2 Tax=Aspergillus niger TaxID=5061 RepID=G3Y8V0_ASPNA|nr:hypothetical protein ASPNIDRAFT_44124 [Aspergillus niger ATCC 1015]KAI2865722.1 hypothetical protein CBS13152_11036 [Aspergillus niger]KAI2924938.1 hypothetical protein CBS63078_2468 [Aspergillus niger]KAI3002109.1 hypothetical protein CBS147345_8458 [Aspergillus niger]KAI3047310.1 hypothetical protein CBS76997_3413 [Aspergillus niger]